jgi:hypothetical protein
MKLPLFRAKQSKSFFAMGLCITLGLSVAALAQADWRDSTLPKIEAELLAQSQLLRGMSDVWAGEVRDRVDFAIFKLRNARLASNPSVENTHLSHACDALRDERALLIQAQLQDAGNPSVLEKLIDETFAHRESLGCRD